MRLQEVSGYAHIVRRLLTNDTRSIVGRCRKDVGVPVILVEDKVQIALLRYLLFGKYFSKSCRANVVGVEGHSDALKVINKF